MNFFVFLWIFLSLMGAMWLEMNYPHWMIREFWQAVLFVLAGLVWFVIAAALGELSYIGTRRRRR